nr:HNH endonuclease [Paraburkholderia sp. Tr-20389]
MREVLNYDPETGVFTNKRAGKGFPRQGKVAGCIDPSTGYRRIRIDRVLYYAQRLAWQYVTGEIPPFEVDHKNGRRDENWFENLRPATRLENSHNIRATKTNKSGRRGVSWHKEKGLWRATIKHDGRWFHLGYFDDPNEAAEVRDLATEMLHGEFAYHFLHTRSSQSQSAHLSPT